MNTRKMRVPLGQVTMGTDQDQARLIAERVARRLAGESKAPERPVSAARNGTSEQPRARIIDFISSGPPIRSASSIASPSVPETRNDESPASPSQELRAPESILTASPWHGRLSRMLGQNPQPAISNPANHPSEERFGIEEATVTELVEFFEKEKQCAMDPSGKPCDHCAMCSGRGF